MTLGRSRWRIRAFYHKYRAVVRRSWRDSRASAPCGGSNPSKGKTKKRPFSRLYAELERFACILFSLAGDGKTLQRTIKNRKEMCLFPAELERFACILFSSRGIGKQNRGIARCAHRTMKAPPGPSIMIRISPKPKRKNLPAAGSFFLAKDCFFNRMRVIVNY